MFWVLMTGLAVGVGCGVAVNFPIAGVERAVGASPVVMSIRGLGVVLTVGAFLVAIMFGVSVLEGVAAVLHATSRKSKGIATIILCIRGTLA